MSLISILKYLFKVVPESEVERMINGERESFRQKLNEANTRCAAAEKEARFAIRDRDQAILDFENAAQAARMSRDLERAAGEELREQVELNAELLQQGFQIAVDARRHSNMVDSGRVQVLTQVTMRRLDVRHGLVNALMSPFAYNVARHLAKKLQASGSLREGQDAIDAPNTEKLIYRIQPALPEKSSS